MQAEDASFVPILTTSGSENKEHNPYLLLC